MRFVALCEAAQRLHQCVMGPAPCYFVADEKAPGVPRQRQPRRRSSARSRAVRWVMKCLKTVNVMCGYVLHVRQVSSPRYPG